MGLKGRGRGVIEEFAGGAISEVGLRGGPVHAPRDSYRTQPGFVSCVAVGAVAREGVSGGLGGRAGDLLEGVGEVFVPRCSDLVVEGCELGH